MLHGMFSDWVLAVKVSEECRFRVAQRLQETEYGRIEIDRKREVDAKNSVEAKNSEAAPKLAAKAAAQLTEKKVRVQPQAQKEAMPTQTPSSRSGTKRPAQDPPQDPRLVGVEVQETKRQKRSAEEADVSTEMEVTNFLLGQRTAFLGAMQATVQDLNGAQFARSSSTSTL